MSDTISEYNEQVIVFNNIKGFKTRAIAGIVSTRETLAQSVKVKPEELADYVGKSLDNPLAPNIVKKAPFLEQHIENPDINSDSCILW